MIMILDKSHSVDIVSDLGDFLLESLSLSNTDDQVLSFLVNQGEALDSLPMIKDVLGESFSLSVSSEHTSETERFRDRKVSFDLNNIKSTKLRGVPAIWISSMTWPLLWLSDW